MAKKTNKAATPTALPKIKFDESFGTMLSRIRKANGCPDPDFGCGRLLWQSFIGCDDAGMNFYDFVEQLNQSSERTEILCEIVVDWYYERHQKYYSRFQSAVNG
ncbi:hypothetical protein ACVWWO_006172 [Bradyrhizobium sp. F1.13.1]